MNTLDSDVLFQGTYRCAVCNEISCIISISSVKVTVYGPPGKVDSLFLKHFSQDGEYRLMPSQALELVDLFQKNDLAKIHSIDREYVPFYCPECDESYCKDHWHRWIEYDEGFYDADYGECPKGHKRMLYD